MSEKQEEEKITPLEEAPIVEEEESFKDKYFRLLAEMDNARKRLQKEKQETTRFAIENVIADILTPIDMLENALGFTQQMSEDTRNWAKGFEMILAQFKEVLSSHNVSSFHSKGEFFDPYKHEAVEIEETENHPEGMILQEFLKGYTCGNRVLRPARVKVAKTPKKNELNSVEEKE